MNILVVQSGGTTPVINSTLAGVIMGGRSSSKRSRIFTANNGVYGAIKGEIIELNNDKAFAKSIIKIPGSSITGTSRVGFLKDIDILNLSKTFKKFSIDAFINIGGNGTLQQSKSIAKAIGDEILVASCPKTVDNDLGDAELNDVFFTPGFPSCINWWNKHLEYLNIENIGAYSHDQVLVAQTFGRDTGFICAGCDAEEKLKDILVYGIPESLETINKLEAEVMSCLKREKRCIVLMSEGLFSKNLVNSRDLAGQIQYSSGSSSSAQYFASYLNKKGINSRSIIPASLQRVFQSEVIDYDRELAFAQGYQCSKSILEGDKEFLISINRNRIDQLNNINYKDLPLKYSRKMKSNFLDGTKPSREYRDYILSMDRLQGLYSKLFQDNT